MDRNDSIVNKIKGLLALANDHKNDEESQTAFLLAQKLMIKHKVSMSEVITERGEIDIQSGQVTSHKKLYWWERTLANIIPMNFRVKYYINSRNSEKSVHIKRAIMFMGFEEDVELAKEMFLLAYEALSLYSKGYVEIYYQQQLLVRTKGNTERIKNSYMRGSLSGLNEKFEEQVEQMKQEYGLMVLVPQEVEKEYNATVTGKPLNYNIPPVEESNAYQKGFKDGNKIDYTKSTIDYHR